MVALRWHGTLQLRHALLTGSTWGNPNPDPNPNPNPKPSYIALLSLAHLRVVPGVVRGRAVEAAVPPLLSGGPLEERLVGEACHVDVHDPEVRQREVLAPRVQAARRLVAHAELEDVARGPATRREQRLVRGAVVVFGEPVRALVAAPLVKERCVRRASNFSVVWCGERAWVHTHAPLSSDPWCGARLLG